MKLISKWMYFLFFSVIIVFVSIFFINSAASSRGGDLLFHEIQIPFNNIGAINDTTSIRNTVGGEAAKQYAFHEVELPYSRIGTELYLNSRKVFPYCLIGGEFDLYIKSTPIQVKDYIKTIPLFYCKTTKDLINNMVIPPSWKDDDLILYCNDANNILSLEHNFEVLTNYRLQAYKVCILKNVDEEKTVLYGYDVGNKVLDSNYDFYDPEAKSGSIISILKNQGSRYSDYNDFDSSAEQKIKVLHHEICELIDNDGTSSKQCEYIPITLEEGRQHLNDELGVQVDHVVIKNFTLYKDCSQTIRTSYDTDGSSLIYFNIDPECKEDRSQKYYYTIFTYTIEYDDFAQDSNTFKDNVGQKEYFFDYNEIQKMFILKDFNDEASTMYLSSVFNYDIDLSRVALFRQINGNKIYGHESPLAVETESGRDLVPVYKINFGNGFGFSRDYCMKMLASFEPKPVKTLTRTDKVLCSSDNEIIINARGVDHYEYSFLKADSYALFKNIILTLK